MVSSALSDADEFPPSTCTVCVCYCLQSQVGWVCTNFYSNLPRQSSSNAVPFEMFSLFISSLFNVTPLYKLHTFLINVIIWPSIAESLLSIICHFLSRICPLFLHAMRIPNIYLIASHIFIKKYNG